MTKQPHTGPTLPTLSPEALAVLQDLTVSAYEIRNADAGLISIDMSAAVVDCEIAMWLAALINAALTPTQPAPLLLDPDNNTEAGQLDALLAEQDSEGVTVAERLDRR